LKRETKFQISGGAILAIALIGLGYAIYKGWIKLPNLFGDIGGGIAEGFKVGGVPGAVGGGVYNAFDLSDKTLGELITENIESGYGEQRFLEDTTPLINLIGGETQTPPTESQLHYKAGEAAVVENYNVPGSIIPVLGTGYAIGTALGLGKARTEYLKTLEPNQRAWERYTEMKRREAFLTSPAGIATNLLSFGAGGILHLAISPKPEEYPLPIRQKTAVKGITQIYREAEKTSSGELKSPLLSGIVQSAIEKTPGIESTVEVIKATGAPGKKIAQPTAISIAETRARLDAKKESMIQSLIERGLR